MASLNESLASLNERLLTHFLSRAVFGYAYLTCQRTPPVILCSCMGELRIRIKIGEHEFECEGPAESVERQAEAFQRMITPAAPPPAIPESSPIAPEEKTAEPQYNTAPDDEQPASIEEKAIAADEKTAQLA